MKMKTRFVLFLFVVAGIALAFAILLPRPRYCAFASFECARRLDADFELPAERENVLRRIVNAIMVYQRDHLARTATFFEHRPECRGQETAVSNAMETIRMSVCKNSPTSPCVVEVRVTCEDSSLACAMADFLVFDFGRWLERQAKLSFEKNMAVDRVAIEGRRRQGREVDDAVLARVNEAWKVFEQDCLKVRTRESAHVESVTRFVDPTDDGRTRAPREPR